MRFTNQLLVSIIIIFSQIFFTDAESSFNKSSLICDSGMCLPTNYRTHEAPGKEMAIEMHLQREKNPVKVEEVNDFKHELTIDMMLMIKWHDPELKLSEPTELANLPTKIVNLLWKPVFFVPRVKSTTIKSFNSDLAGFFVSNHTGNLTIKHRLAMPSLCAVTCQVFAHLPPDIVTSKNKVQRGLPFQAA